MNPDRLLLYKLAKAEVMLRNAKAWEVAAQDPSAVATYVRKVITDVLPMPGHTISDSDIGIVLCAIATLAEEIQAQWTDAHEKTA